jgi:hypothetical protein
MSTLTFGNVYTKIFGGLVFLSNDPHPEVAAMASKLVEYLKNRAADKEAARLVIFLGDKLDPDGKMQRNILCRYS